MREDVGDLWKYPCDVRVIPTNGVITREGLLVMASGLALECVKRHPGIDKLLGAAVHKHGNVPLFVSGYSILTFPTRWHWKKPADLHLIAKSAEILMKHADSNLWLRVALPRVGCGLGGLKWETVKSVLDPILDQRFVVLTRTKDEL